MIEWYDATHAGEPAWGERGQFVSRYLLSTLENGDHVGINLYGGEPAWQVTAQNVADALRFERETRA